MRSRTVVLTIAGDGRVEVRRGCAFCGATLETCGRGCGDPDGAWICEACVSFFYGRLAIRAC